MLPVFFIKGKVRPCLEHFVFLHSSYDETKVVNYRILVSVKYSSAYSVVVTPRCEKFGGNMFVICACQFSDKG